MERGFSPIKIMKIYQKHYRLLFIITVVLTLKVFAFADDLAEREVKIDVSPTVQLAGTLTIPNGKAPFPAILLITSAGGQSRNQIVDGVPMFRLISQHLAKNGFAVLRMDERGVGDSSGGSVWDSTTAEKASDMQACVNFLKKLPEIDANKIGLIGHSEGAMVAPMVALNEPAIRFVVLLGSPGIDGGEIWNRQQNEEAKKRTSNATILQSVEIQRRKLIEFIKSGKNDDETFYRIGHNYFAAFGMPESSINRNLIDENFGILRKKWFSFFFAHNPTQILKKLRIPMLFIAGSADEQVPVEQNLNPLVSTLIEGKNQDFSVVVLPKLNHFFLVWENGGKPELSSELLETITNWLKPKFK